MQSPASRTIWMLGFLFGDINSLRKKENPLYKEHRGDFTN